MVFVRSKVRRGNEGTGYVRFGGYDGFILDVTHVAVRPFGHNDAGLVSKPLIRGGQVFEILFLFDDFDAVLLFRFFLHGLDELVGDVDCVVKVFVVDGDVVGLGRNVERLLVVFDAAFRVVIIVPAGRETGKALFRRCQNADGIDVHG